MIRVRVVRPCVARLVLKPGDEIHQGAMTPEMEAFLNAAHVDGNYVAELVRDEDESAVLDVPTETTTIRGRHRR